VSANFAYGGVYGFSLSLREEGEDPSIRLFTDNFRIGLGSKLPGGRSKRRTQEDENEIDNVKSKASFIINFPGWSGVKLPNSNKAFFGQASKGNMSIFSGPNMEIMERCLSETGHINFVTIKSLAGESLKLLQDVHAESFIIQVFFPIMVQEIPGRRILKAILGETIQSGTTIQVPAAYLYVCPFAQDDRIKNFVHFDIDIDAKDYLIIGQKGFYLEEGLDDLETPASFVQEDLPMGAEDAVCLYMLDNSSQAEYYRRSWLNPDCCALIVPPGGVIDIRYEKKGKEYEIPRISAGDSHVTLILSDWFW